MFNLQDPKLDDDMRDNLTGLQERALAHGVTGDNLNLFLYIDNFLDELCEECFPVPLTAEERFALISHMLQDCDPKDLNCFRASIVRYVKGTKADKVAYPTSLRINRPKEGYQGYWGQLLTQISKLRAAGIQTFDAVRRAANQIPELTERLRFLTWYGLKFQNGRNLSYLAAGEQMPDISKIASYLNEDPYVYEFKKRINDPAHEDHTPPSQLNQDPQSMVEFEALRTKMVGRTFAIDKLLDKYRDTLKSDQFEEIEASLNDLRTKIRKLKHATLCDVLTKKANQFAKLGWKHGAAALSVLASDGDGVFEEVASTDDSTSMQEVISHLEEISASLRQRTVIRELAAIDIDLFNLGFGHITEVQDASAKLMEAHNSATNKLDDIIGKLRSDHQQQTAPRAAPTKIKQLTNPRDLPISKIMQKEEDRAAKERAMQAEPVDGKVVEEAPVGEAELDKLLESVPAVEQDKPIAITPPKV